MMLVRLVKTHGQYAFVEHDGVIYECYAEDLESTNDGMYRVDPTRIWLA